MFNVKQNKDGAHGKEAFSGEGVSLSEIDY